MDNNDKSAHLLPLILIIRLSFLWGMANNLLITWFKKVFAPSALKAGLVQSASYTGYFVFSTPAAVWAKRFGYKAAVMFGLLRNGEFIFLCPHQKSRPSG